MYKLVLHNIHSTLLPEYFQFMKFASSDLPEDHGKKESAFAMSVFFILDNIVILTVKVTLKVKPCYIV